MSENELWVKLSEAYKSLVTVMEALGREQNLRMALQDELADKHGLDASAVYQRAAAIQARVAAKVAATVPPSGTPSTESRENALRKMQDQIEALLRAVPAREQ